VSSCEHGNETVGSVEGWKLLDHMGEYELLKDSAPWT